MRSVAGSAAMAVDVVGSEDIIRDCESLSHRCPGTGNCEDQKKRHLVHTSRTSSWCDFVQQLCFYCCAAPEARWSLASVFPARGVRPPARKIEFRKIRVKVSTPAPSALGQSPRPSRLLPWRLPPRHP